MKFQEKLVQLRKENELSQEQLAEKLGVSRQAISRWEAVDTTPDIESAATQPQVDEKQAGRARRKFFHFSLMISYVLAALLVAIVGAFAGMIHPLLLIGSFLFLAAFNMILWLCL